MSLKELDRGERFIFYWQYGLLGDFYESLAEAMMRADEDNLGKLELAFPDEVKALKKYKEDYYWWESVKERANFFYGFEENLYRCDWCGRHVSKIYEKNRCYDCSIAYDFPDY